MDRSRSKHRPADEPTLETPAIGIDAVISDAIASVFFTLTVVFSGFTAIILYVLRQYLGTHNSLSMK